MSAGSILAVDVTAGDHGSPVPALLRLSPARSKKPNPDNYYDRLGAAMIRALRHRYPSVAAFAGAIASELGWPNLSRQAIYDWEMARSRVPLSVLLAASALDQRQLELSPGAAGDGRRAGRVDRRDRRQPLVVPRRTGPRGGDAAGRDSSHRGSFGQLPLNQLRHDGPADMPLLDDKSFRDLSSAVKSDVLCRTREKLWSGRKPLRASPRENEVLSLLAMGLSDKQIGSKLGISPRTVQKHFGQFCLRNDVRGRCQAVAVWMTADSRRTTVTDLPT
jgi:DNA-binding CsgD family transcriptional regulator